MKRITNNFWKYALTLLFGGFLFLAVIIAVGIYYPLAAVAIVALIVAGWWYAMHTAPVYPDDYDAPELKERQTT